MVGARRVDMGNENSSQGDKKGGKFVVGIVILIVIILVLAGTVVYLLISKKPEEVQTSNEKRNVVVTPDNMDEVADIINGSGEPTPAGYYTATMNYEWRFKKGNEASYNAYVENATGNTNAVYIDLFRVEDEENAIYKSPVIPVGSSLRDIILDTPLEKGTYDCVAVYHLVDDDQNTISTLRVTVTVIVEE
jgi:hypothetical protein